VRILTFWVAPEEIIEALKEAEFEDFEVSPFFFTLVTGPRRSLSLKLSDTRVYEPDFEVIRGWGPSYLVSASLPNTP